MIVIKLIFYFGVGIMFLILICEAVLAIKGKKKSGKLY